MARRWPWRRAARLRDREAEMQSHLDLYRDELLARGVAADDAAREARLRFGNARAKLEEVADMQRLPMLDALWQDTRHACRSLRATPVFSLTAVLTLALAIGANTSVFSLADTLLLRPLPYPEPDRLAQLVYTQHGPDGDDESQSTDGAMWEAVRDRAPSLETAVAGLSGGANLFVNGTALYVSQQRVSEGYSRVLGVAPARGTWFGPDADRAGGPAVAVLSDGLWRRAFGGAGDIVGRSILLKGEPHQVVGVMPPGFIGTAAADVWTPLRPSPTGEGAGTNYQVIARVKPGVTWAQATGEVLAASAAGFRLFEPRAGMVRELKLQPLRDALAGGMREPVVLLGWAVGAVLLIACVNLAALMLARGGSRAREIATRMALGGGRGVVVRQLMVEAVVLALAGGVIGVLVAQLGVTGLQALGGDRFEEWRRAAIDLRVLLAAFGLTMLTSVAFGLAPALQATRMDIAWALTQGGTRTASGRSSTWTRRALVAVEVALGVVLLVSTGLLVRTFINVRALAPGFDPNGVVTATVSLQDARYRDAVSVNRLFDDTLQRLQATSGIESAAVSLQLPYERLLNNGMRFLDDPTASSRTTNAAYVTPGFFVTLRIPLTQGRAISEGDRVGAPLVAVVNETFARVYSKDRPALGRRIRLGGADREIVGVMGDIEQRPSFNIEGVSGAPVVSLPLVVIPAAQSSDGYFRSAHTWFSPAFIVRARDPGMAALAVRQAIAAVDPQLPVSSVRSMAEVMAAAMTLQRLLMALVGALAGAALFLAAIGVYGVIAHSVAERRREFGIRIALGSTAGAAVRAVTLSGIGLVAVGAAAGLALSIPATSLVRAFLWRVDAGDPITYAGVGVVLLVVAAAASLLPALKLLRLDPVETLKS